MAPKFHVGEADLSPMALNFLTKRRMTSNCAHKSLVRIEVAGMSREVCAECGRVSLGYIEPHHGTALVRPGRASLPTWTALQPLRTDPTPSSRIPNPRAER